MSGNSKSASVVNWRLGLPVQTGRLVTLREPEARDASALASLLALDDASRFSVEEMSCAIAARALIAAAARDRSAGRGFTYLIADRLTDTAIGLIQMRQLASGPEAAECECTIAPSARGTGVFMDAAHLAVSFAFEAVGVRRIEIRASAENGRANGALRKLGAVLEGVLRRSVRRGDRYVDQTLWALLKDDWQPGWRSTRDAVH